MKIITLRQPPEDLEAAIANFQDKGATEEKQIVYNDCFHRVYQIQL